MSYLNLFWLYSRLCRLDLVGKTVKGEIEKQTRKPWKTCLHKTTKNKDFEIFGKSSAKNIDSINEANSGWKILIFEENLRKSTCTTTTSFQWTDGSTTGTDGFQWVTGQPDNSDGVSNYVVILVGSKLMDDTNDTGSRDGVVCGVAAT
ncbi:unnamed protein product [Caenorhabditis angaria]|uniref:C-type lectin domain-containing protein n=1 Tax=Caenorhabditis angaria TaxID=860376 RepID=A0A9P1IKS3_9PELO|nr:unnamed protein product [Caenorhabditis angaria]